MIENRRRVLDMLAEGKISVDEAERLLSLVDVSPAPDSGGQTPSAPREGPPRYLRVTVEEPDERVNIRVPLALVRAGMKLTALIPSQAADGINQALKDKGIDMDVQNLGADGLDELIDAFADLEVEVQSDKEQVHIWVE
jgi:hypothetical protein